MTKNVIAFAFAGILTLLLVFWFIWPTPYYYTEIRLSDNTYPVRIQRLSGATHMLLPTGWINLESDRGLFAESSTAIPADDISQLSGSARIRGSSFIADIYNGSAWVVTNLEVQLTVKPHATFTLFSRRYRIWCTRAGNRGEPLTSSTYSCDLGQYLGDDYDPTKFEWRILSAYGFKD